MLTQHHLCPLNIEDEESGDDEESADEEEEEEASMARTLTSTDAAPEARHLLVMEVGKEARKDPVPHGTPADQYLTKKYFGASDVLFQMVPMPDGSSLWMDEQSMLKKLPRNFEAEWRFGQDVHCGRLHGTVVWAPKEEQDEQMEPAEAPVEVQDRVDLTVKQIKSIVPKAKGSKKKDVQRSAMEVATYAQIKKLHKRLGFRDNANTQAVRANISHLWFAAQ